MPQSQVSVCICFYLTKTTIQVYMYERKINMESVLQRELSKMELGGR